MSTIMLAHHLAAVDQNKLRHALDEGVETYLRRHRGRNLRRTSDRAIVASVRATHGFHKRAADLLTLPADQLKLGKSSKPAVGLTLHHNTMRSGLSPHTTINSCEHAGVCIRVCVLNNGNGMYPAVQRAWRWKTDLFLHRPMVAARLMGYELARAIDKFGDILGRFDVNSDIQWQHAMTALVDGTVFGDDLMAYGYTKYATILQGDGWVTPFYRQAYSLNEKSDGRSAEFLRNGGSVAVVTDRYYGKKYKQPIKQWHPEFEVVDADQTDEWMFEESVVGDLAFKPRTTEIREFGLSTNFTAKVYGKYGIPATVNDCKADLGVKVSVR